MPDTHALVACSSWQGAPCCQVGFHRADICLKHHSTHLGVACDRCGGVCRRSVLAILALCRERRLGAWSPPVALLQCTRDRLRLQMSVGTPDGSCIHPAPWAHLLNVPTCSPEDMVAAAGPRSHQAFRRMQHFGSRWLPRSVCRCACQPCLDLLTAVKTSLTLLLLCLVCMERPGVEQCMGYWPC